MNEQTEKQLQGCMTLVLLMCVCVAGLASISFLLAFL